MEPVRFFGSTHIIIYFSITNDFVNYRFQTFYSAIKKPPFIGWLCYMAEKEGFEPSIGFKAYTPLAGERLQPLGHFSRFIVLLRFYSYTGSAILRAPALRPSGHGNKQTLPCSKLFLAILSAARPFLKILSFKSSRSHYESIFL